jgi:hypothetical protein
MQKAQNEMSVDACRMMFPKAKWNLPEKSKTMKAEMPESALQSFANEAILLRGWQYIRFPSVLMGWIYRTAPEWAKRQFFSQVAGKMPDSTVIVPIGKGLFVGMKLELKTQDKDGRAVGKLHGKQKYYAKQDEWIIARSPEQISEALDKLSLLIEKIKAIL